MRANSRIPHVLRVVKIIARCMCPKHGRLILDEIDVRNGFPVCKKCLSRLEFCTVRPRKLEK